MQRAWLPCALTLVLTLAGASGGVRAQQPQAAQPAGQAPVPPAAQAQPAPTFRTGVELVRVDVRITDANGRPITDIRADEIEVTEGGAARPVVLFQRVAQPSGSYAEIAQRTIASEVSTNQGSPRGSVYVLVFDQLHITPGNEQRARRAAERFLRTRIRPGDRIALYAVPAPGPQIDFTSDVSRATRELVSVRGSRTDVEAAAMGAIRVSDAYEIVRGNPELLEKYVNRSTDSPGTTDAPASASRTSPRAIPQTADDLRELRASMVEDARTVVMHADGQSRTFLQGLAAIVRSLRDIDGRKSVILFSEGFEIDNVRREVEDVAAAAAQSYSVIHALDLNIRATPLTQEVPADLAIGTAILNRLESIGSLTAETDGELFKDAGADADRALDQISDASQDYYLVGFEPGLGALADRSRYRRIKVTVTRPGARASARSGYAVGAVATPADRRRAIDGALRAPFSQQGLRVEYTTYVLKGSAADTQRVILSLAAELPVAAPGAPPADVVFAVRDTRDGRLAASGSDTMSLPESTRRGSTAGTGYFRVQFELPPGQYLMRAVVREPGGLLGSADRRFQVRALGGPGLTAGDIVLSSSDTAGLPVRTVVYSEEVLSGVVELYARTPAQIEGATVTAGLLPFGGTTAVTAGRADLLPVKATTSGVSRGARIEIPLQGIAPGEYLVRAVVRSGGETAAELLRDVIVAAGPRPAAPDTAARPSGPAPALTESFDPQAVLHGDVARRFADRTRERAAAKASDAGASAAARGLAAFGARDYAAAITALNACVDAEPQNAAAGFVLGWAHAASGDDRAAVSAWRLAVIADSTMVPAYLALIDAYMRLGSPDLALQVARSGLISLPDSVELRDRVSRLERR